MLLRQLFDAETSTYTYLLADETTREAARIDPVLEQVERDLKLVEELGLKLVLVLETHVHADHVTSAGTLRARTGATVVASGRGAPCVDRKVLAGKPPDAFITFMKSRQLPPPKRLEVAVPANRACGLGGLS